MKRPTADASLGPVAAAPYEILHLAADVAADVAADIAGVVGDAAAAADVAGAAAEAAVGGVAVVDQGTSL